MENTKKFIKRICWSALLIVICYYTIFLSPEWFYFLVVEAFILLGLSEYFDMASRKGIFINKNLGLIFGAILPLAYYFPGESIIFMVTILCLFLINFHKETVQHALISASVTLMGIFYMAWFFSFFMKLKYIPHGSHWVAYVILVTKLNDAGAYFIGERLGKHRFIPHISPKKSVEGAIGGLLFSIIVSLISKLYLPHVSLLQLFILGTVLGVLAQVGDLVESLIKRDFGAKDSGNIPGLGGILDVVDSLLFTLPFLYYCLTAIPGINI